MPVSSDIVNIERLDTVVDINNVNVQIFEFRMNVLTSFCYICTLQLSHTICLHRTPEHSTNTKKVSKDVKNYKTFKK